MILHFSFFKNKFNKIPSLGPSHLAGLRGMGAIKPMVISSGSNWEVSFLNSTSTERNDQLMRSVGIGVERGQYTVISRSIWFFHEY